DAATVAVAHSAGRTIEEMSLVARHNHVIVSVKLKAGVEVRSLCLTVRGRPKRFTSGSAFSILPLQFLPFGPEPTATQPTEDFLMSMLGILATQLDAKKEQPKPTACEACPVKAAEDRKRYLDDL